MYRNFPKAIFDFYVSEWESKHFFQVLKFALICLSNKIMIVDFDHFEPLNQSCEVVGMLQTGMCSTRGTWF